MAHFYGSVQGNRGEATRLGSKNSGLVGIVDGWNFGVRVEARHIDGEDVFDIYVTNGSNNKHEERLLLTLTEDDYEATK